jgi:cytochrome P450
MSAPGGPAVQINRSFFRSLSAFNENRLLWFDTAAAAGPVTQLRFGRVKSWVVTDPDIARQMLMADGASWERPPAAYVPIRLGVGENLFTQNDAEWALLQPAVAPAFRRRAMEQRLGSMGEIIDETLQAWSNGQFIDVELETGALALQLAAWVLFGDRLDLRRAQNLASHQRSVVEWVGHRIGRVYSSVPVARGRAAKEMRVHRAALHSYADEVVAAARNRKESSDDTVGLLLNANPGGRPLSGANLRSHVLGLLLAGNETTAAALTWALINAARHPGEWALLRNDPTSARARAFIDETLRLTPAVWGFSRRPKRRGVVLAGDRVARTGVVTVYLRGMNRDPNRWPEPLAFRPARHRHTTLDGVSDAEGRATLLAFGLGPRGCIGQHLAMAEMIEVLPRLAALGDVRIDQEVVEDPSFALRVKGGLQACFVASH